MPYDGDLNDFAPEPLGPLGAPFTGRILDTAEMIRRAGGNYHQRLWFHECGTPACVAGHICALAGKTREDFFADCRGDEADLPRFERFCAEYIGIEMSQATALFFGNPGMNHPTPEIAGRTLEILAATGKVDWYRAAYEIPKGIEAPELARRWYEWSSTKQAAAAA